MSVSFQIPDSPVSGACPVYPSIARGEQTSPRRIAALILPFSKMSCSQRRYPGCEPHYPICSNYCLIPFALVSVSGVRIFDSWLPARKRLPARKSKANGFS
jgi:hypothetical protein